LQNSDVSVEILLPEDIPAQEFQALSSRAGLIFARSHLKWAWEDPQWTELLAAVRKADNLVGRLPISLSRTSAWPHKLYEVNDLTGEAGYGPSSICFLGGHEDIRSSMLFDSSLNAHERYLIASGAIHALDLELFAEEPKLLRGAVAEKACHRTQRSD
jgi:hypothetical protein